MRVLMFVPEYPPIASGGLERQAHLLGRELVARGCSVHVLTVDGRADRERVEYEGIRISRLPKTHVGGRARMLARWLMRFAPHFDVCHVHGLSSVSVFVANLCHVRRVPTLIKLPNFGSAGIPGMLERPLGRIWRVGFVRADAAVAMMHQSLAELDAIGYPRSRVFCTTNGVEIPALARDHAAVGTDPVFIFAGRVEQKKGVRELIEAWTVAHPALPPESRLRIVGEGPLVDELRATVDRRGLAESVQFVPWRTNPLPEYLRADVCVLPSYLEGNSNTVLEAMAAGLAVICTDVGGNRMLVGPEGAPLSCDAGDVPALAGLLVRLGRDRAERARVGAAMRTRAESHFAISGVAEGYMRVYDALAHRRRDEAHACGLQSFEAA